MVDGPFHAGELAVQERLGVRVKMDAIGRHNIRPVLTGQIREFLAQLPFILLGAADHDGQPWATMLAGLPGFMATPDIHTVVIRAEPGAGDPLHHALSVGTQVGLLGIELPTRRRNRVNGKIVGRADREIVLSVAQTFGNCPQYIQSRSSQFAPAPDAARQAPPIVSDRLAELDQALIRRADTLFIATANGRPEAGAARGADVSHRGGNPGFVRVDDDRSLCFPDFVGNFLFQTLGNLTVDRRCGLLFIDWESGDLLQLAGEAEIIWDGPEVRAFAGAERLVRFRLRQAIRNQAALPLHFSEPGFSPLLSRTGNWADAARALEAETSRNTWRPFRVVSVTGESSVVRSFVLEPADGGGVAVHLAGQHLPIRLAIPGQEGPTRRVYTLSEAANGRTLRISTRRDGLASRWMHDHVAAGDIIEALAPRGSFTFDSESRRPAVLVSAGIGITPTIAMLNSLLVNDGRTRHQAGLYVIHGARNGAEQAFAAHLRAMAIRHSNLAVHVRHSAPGPKDRPDSVGRVDIDLLKQVLPFDDYDFYLCGPGGFMQSLYDGLRGLGIADARIHFESFGPSTVRRDRRAQAPGGERIEVEFASSGRKAFWRPGDGTLLEFAEAQGLTPPYSCRAGLCGTCATRIVAGSVDYREPPTAEIAPDQVLICCSTPRPGPHLAGPDGDDSLDREGIILAL